MYVCVRVAGLSFRSRCGDPVGLGGPRPPSIPPARSLRESGEKKKKKRGISTDLGGRTHIRLDSGFSSLISGTAGFAGHTHTHAHGNNTPIRRAALAEWCLRNRPTLSSGGKFVFWFFSSSMLRCRFVCFHCFFLYKQ